ncbi:putative alkyl hydroperoxide reductase, thiol specific antioxidant [Planoprotostelium fungivorum]|uniref:Putative alkyl hydroperoxide reductase, thiol specific antioxidant n=1 Tax=Planoprotostelium fungivorum TaxID=1890364 RepID=A0A2P6NGX6_9EUKA|nr:putative alkyl hydroperoxide reductase, thiol specific antioxidant [Planoprotostelium fungivorum]
MLFQIQHPAPEWSAECVTGGRLRQVSLADFRGKYLVMLFYPGDFNPHCVAPIHSFSSKVEQFQKVNCNVVAISTDSKMCHLQWTKTSPEAGGVGEINLPLIADTTHKISREYNVYQDQEGIAYRGTFIISKDGVVRHMSVSDAAGLPSVEETLRMVQLFQRSDHEDDAFVYSK